MSKSFLYLLGVLAFALVIAAFIYAMGNAHAQVVASPCVAPAGDSINSITYNPDGSVDAFVQFNNGAGVTGVTDIHLPVPIPVTGATIVNGQPNIISPAVPWSNSNIMATLQPIASAKKAAWAASIAGTTLIGATTF